jgi:excisionase family DNA binding protein
MLKDNTTDDSKTGASGQKNPQISSDPAASDPRRNYPPVLTAAELAEIMRVDRRVIYDMVDAHEIPGARGLRRQLRFDRDVVLRWLRATRPSTTS